MLKCVQVLLGYDMVGLDGRIILALILQKVKFIRSNGELRNGLQVMKHMQVKGRKEDDWRELELALCRSADGLNVTKFKPALLCIHLFLFL